MLTVSHLCLTYAAPAPALPVRAALEDVSFTLAAGERVAVVGQNGAGKSSLLLSLIGVLSPQAGFITLDDLTLCKKTLARYRERVGMIFQHPEDQLFLPTVYDDVAFGPRNAKRPPDEMARVVEQMLTRLQILPLGQRFSHQLSGGEKRLVALAGVLVMQPQLLLLDEPTSFLDPKSRRTLMELLVQLDQAMLLSTHDLDFALQVCQRVILLQEGRMVADGAAGDLLTDEALLLSCGLELPLSLQGVPKTSCNAKATPKPRQDSPNNGIKQESNGL